MAYRADLQRLLREQGPFDVVHSHMQLFSGLVLREAHRADVPGRIAHARNSQDGQGNAPLRRAYRALMRRWIRRYTTHLFAVSTTAAEGAFGKGVVDSGRCRILTGVDFSPFQAEGDRDRVRAELGIPGGTLVVGHVGSFRRQKNHQFLVEIARRLVELQPDTRFLLIGKGELRPSFEEVVRSWGLADAVRLLGERNDVPRLLRAMDVFVFPSLYEGLPRVLIEAQAVGLLCVASNRITPEAAAWPDSVRFLPLEEGPEVWAQVLAAAAQESTSPARGAEAIRRFEARGLSIVANALELTDLYEKIASTGRPRNR
jgi:glycosyltransferase involved in cell wall biosynthesis